MQDVEEWREVPGYEGRYEVSDRGRVRSLGPAKTFKQSYGGVTKTVTRGKSQRILRPDTDRDGYLRFTLTNTSSVSRHWGCHVLVAMAWHPNPDNIPEVAHLDHNRQNNAPSNLKWASRSGNHSDSVIENRYANAGPNAGFKRTFTANEVRAIRALYAAGETPTAIATSLGLKPKQIHKIVYGERWRHLA